MILMGSYDESTKLTCMDFIHARVLGTSAAGCATIASKVCEATCQPCWRISLQCCTKEGPSKSLIASIGTR
jgi:hypothetical protein